MNQKLLYLILLLLAVCTSCVKSNYQSSYPQPAGTFKGVFGYLHRRNDQAPFDTLLAKVTLTLQNSDGTYTVTGDTTTLQAGSYGTYALNTTTIVFTDKTASSVATQAKKHLNGSYAYYFDGVDLNLVSNIADTISMQYQLVKN